MKKSIIFLLPFIFLLLSSCNTTTEETTTEKEKKVVIDMEKEKAKVTELLDLLATSTESGNLEMVEKIWCPKEDVLLIGTENDEKLEGWSQIKEAMTGQFNSFEETLISITDQKVSLDRDARTAWFYEELNYNFIYNNKAMSIDGIRYTGVFVKSDEGEWRLVQGHFSIPTSIDMTKK
jgi:ketosteroid isomerase-like protein